MKTKLTILPIVVIALFTSCASLQKAQPYFEVAAAIGTQEFLNSAKDPGTRTEYVAIIQEVGNVVATLSSGALLTPEQFHATVVARIPQSTTSLHFIAVIDGVYAVAYVDFSARPELKNDYLNRLATIILANAH